MHIPSREMPTKAMCSRHSRDEAIHDGSFHLNGSRVFFKWKQFQDIHIASMF